MSKVVYSLLLLMIVIFVCCKKDKGKILGSIVTEEPIAQPPRDTADFTCLPVDSLPSMSKDTTADESKNVRHWQYNPSNYNEVIYITNLSQLWSYNFNTKQRVHLADNIMYWPQVNSFGWVVFTNLSFAIYKVKTNGDSLTRLTFDGGGDGKWDHTGNAIYYFLGPGNNLFKIDKNGKPLDTVRGSIDAGFLHNAYCKKSNKMVYQKLINNKMYIYQMDLATRTETMIVQNGGGSLTMDNTDENVYWQNDGGVFKCNIATKKLDTLVKSCLNYKFYGTIIGPGIDKLAMVWHRLKPLRKNRLFHEFRSFEIDLNDPTHKLKEVHLFP